MKSLMNCRNIVYITFGLIALLLLVRGEQLLTKSPTYGNPRFEDIIEQCQEPTTGAVVRYYLGNGGATTDYWYTVTYQETASSKELHFFHSYGSPRVEHIYCEPNSVEVQTREGVYTYDIQQIKVDLVNNPISYSHDRPATPTRGITFDTICGSCLICLGGFTLMVVIGARVVMR